VNTVIATLHEEGGPNGQEGGCAPSRVRAWSWMPGAEALWWVAASSALGTTALAVVGIWAGTP
jgi:hypothetical protein